jgi:hypothetical protein
MGMPQRPHGEDPLLVTKFYYSHTLLYLMSEWRQEIRRRLAELLPWNIGLASPMRLAA